MKNDFSAFDTSSIVFSVFDFDLGSQPVYYTIDENIALRVALKSQLTLSMVRDEQETEDTDAVIPFPDIEKIGYIYLFKIAGIHEREGSHLASLTYLVDVSKRMEVYRLITVLRHQAEMVSKEIKSRFIYKKNKALPHDIEEKLNNWNNGLEETYISLENEYKHLEVTIRDSDVEPSFSFLFSNIKKMREFEQLIASLLISKPIYVISSSNTITNLAIATLNNFIPYKELRIARHAEKTLNTPNVDLIVIDRAFFKKPPKEEILLDLDKGRVFNGTKSTFVEKLLKDIKDKNQEEANIIVKNRTLWLLEYVSQITEAFSVITDEQERQKVIFKIQKEAPEALNIIIEIAANTSPVIAKFLRSEMGRWKERALTFDKRGW